MVAVFGTIDALGGPQTRETAKGNPMTSTTTRADLSRALAKAIAYRDCGKPAKAAAWAAELVKLLEAEAILTVEAKCLPLI